MSDFDEKKNELLKAHETAVVSVAHAAFEHAQALAAYHEAVAALDQAKLRLETAASGERLRRKDAAEVLAEAMRFSFTVHHNVGPRQCAVCGINEARVLRLNDGRVLCGTCFDTDAS